PAELCGVPLTIGVERPASFPGVDRARQLGRVSDRRLDLFDRGVSLPVRNRDTGRGKLLDCILQCASGIRLGYLPPRGLQQRKGVWASRRWWIGRALQPGIAWIAAGPRRNIDGH